MLLFQKKCIDEPFGCQLHEAACFAQAWQTKASPMWMLRRNFASLGKCPLPGAAKLLKLTKMVSTMSSASSSSAKKVQRKKRSGAWHLNPPGVFAARARKAYSKRTAERKPSPAEVQRRIDQSLPEPPTDVTSAIEWLLQNKFVRKPRKCSDCGGLNIKRVFGL